MMRAGGAILVACLISGTSIVSAGDCNGNGIPDESDLVATFQGLGDLPGGIIFSQADAVSANGSVVVGASISLSGQEPFRWVRGGGMVGLGHLPQSSASDASDVSGDGSVVVGRSGGEAFRWTAGTGMVGLGHMSEYCSISTPPAVSADGSLVVGGDCLCGFYTLDDCLAFKWTTGEGIVHLGDPSDGFESAATGVSADGSVIVGYRGWDQSGCDCIATGIGGCGFTIPVQWTAGAGMTVLDGFSLYCSSQANDVSADGSFVVGSVVPQSAFRWTGGGTTIMNVPPGLRVVSSSAYGVSGDGSVVVGMAAFPAQYEAFIWDAQNGLRPLRAALVNEHGLDLTGWTLTSAQDVSRDGRSIVGHGKNHAGFTEAWIATLPELDSDGDGVLDACDACGQSNTERTLRVGDCQTGIANAADPEGCTLADRLSAACSLPIDVMARGEFVDCVSRLANDWRHDGSISPDEAGRLVSCAAHASKSTQRANQSSSSEVRRER